MGGDADATPSSRLLALGTLATVVAVIANRLVLQAGLAVTRLPPLYRPDAPGPIVAPAAAAIAATALSVVLRRTVARPFAVFVRLIAVGLVVSFAPIAVVFWRYDVDWLGVAVLVTMHVAVAAVVVGVFAPSGAAGTTSPGGE